MPQRGNLPLLSNGVVPPHAHFRYSALNLQRRDIEKVGAGYKSIKRPEIHWQLHYRILDADLLVLFKRGCQYWQFVLSEEIPSSLFFSAAVLNQTADSFNLSILSPFCSCSTTELGCFERKLTN